MSDQPQEGLFETSDDEGKPLQALHVCAKCNTGYATDECKAAARRWLIDMPPEAAHAIAEQLAKPGGITRVGPPVDLRPVNAVSHDWYAKAQSVIQSLLTEIIGEQLEDGKQREGLRETPARVVKAWQHWTDGYNVDIPKLFKTFEDGAENADEMVVRKGIRIYSHCEHHLAPIIGDCTIAYIPRNRVVGLSKLDRVADAFARRLQVQERLTNQIADAIWQHLEPLGVGVYINARHMCIESRGVQQSNSDTVTCALRGVMKTQAEARAEFLSLARGV